MRKIDKNYDTILSLKYRDWIDGYESNDKKHPLSRTYYDDVVMELYRCQKGVCAYTEMKICPPELYLESNWEDGKYKLLNDSEIKRNEHLGELEHFDNNLKNEKYWHWSNLFMAESKINSIKADKEVVEYLKPDLEDYSPEKYFDYDYETHRYTPNTEIEDEQMTKEIGYMINDVLSLNLGMIRLERKAYIHDLKLKIDEGKEVNIDRYFTSVKWTLDIQIDN